MALESLNISFTAVMPEMLLAGLAAIVLVADFFLGHRGKVVLGYLSVAGLVMLLPITAMSVAPAPSFGGSVTADAYAVFFKVIFIIAGILTLAVSSDYLKKSSVHRGEYYYLVLFAILGMMVLASANDLLNFYVGLELMALSFYILVALGAGRTMAVEGALKYFILGALSSGILLYGIACAYGFAGSTNLMEIARQAIQAPAQHPFLLLAIVLIVAGFAFKVALFPFHLWAPDAYQGAPVPVAALLSVGSKAAAFAVFLRIFAVALPASQPRWSELLWLLSVGTMIFGSVVAISQKSIIRMMAYSSIAHAGIIVIGLLVRTRIGMAGILYYLMVYTFMNMGVFTVITLLLKKDRSGENLPDFKGLAARHPVCAFLMALYLLALAGVPPTGGFTAKFFILAAAVEAGYYWLAAIGVIATAIALFFYTKVIYYMYMKAPEGTFMDSRPGTASRLVLLVTAAGTIIPGVYPAPFMEWALKAIEPLFM
jgi:NADH-quinone oxidoreductase subunit N